MLESRSKIELQAWVRSTDIRMADKHLTGTDFVPEHVSPAHLLHLQGDVAPLCLHEHTAALTAKASLDP